MESTTALKENEMTVKVAVTTFDGYLVVAEAATVKEAIAKVEAKGHPMMKFHVISVTK